MEGFENIDSTTAAWKAVSEGVEMLTLRSEPGANRVLLRLAPGKSYPTHHHSVAEEVYVIEGVYEDMGRRFGPGSYLYYPPESVHNAFSSDGCTFLVINNKVP